MHVSLPVVVTDVWFANLCRSSAAMQTPQVPPSQQNIPDNTSTTALPDLPGHLLAQLLHEVASPLRICKAFAPLARDPYFRLMRGARRYKNLFPAAVAADDSLLAVARDLLTIEGRRFLAEQRAHYLPYFKAQLCIFIEQAARAGQLQEVEHGLQLAQQNGIRQLPTTPSMAAAYDSASSQGRHGLCGLFEELGMPRGRQNSASDGRYGSLQDSKLCPSITCS
jgi:hypothetical protein